MKDAFRFTFSLLIYLVALSAFKWLIGADVNFSDVESLTMIIIAAMFTILATIREERK